VIEKKDFSLFFYLFGVELFGLIVEKRFFLYKIYHMKKFIKKKIPKINELCRKYKVKTLYLFGSACTPKFNKKSDIDFLIDFDEVQLLDYADNYFDFQEALEKLLNRRVDLVVEKAITNPYFKNIVERTRTLIYG
jgi:predicted nucleotidyltransferase